jgi:hypothetical protein
MVRIGQAPAAEANVGRKVAGLIGSRARPSCLRYFEEIDIWRCATRDAISME